MKTQDEFHNRYNASNICAKAATICFSVNAVFAFLALVTPDCVRSFFLGGQFFLALAYVALTVIDNCFLWYNAEKGRIKDNIANAFSVNLMEERTEGYYSNNEEPSIKKYAVNTYESAYYSREESKAMRPYAIVKIVVAIGIVFLLTLVRSVDMSLILWIAQTMFSSVVIIDCIQLIAFSFKVNDICGEFYAHLIAEGGNVTLNSEVKLVSCIVEYETTKMYFKVRLCQKVFEQLKPELEVGWAKLLSQIK